MNTNVTLTMVRIIEHDFLMSFGEWLRSARLDNNFTLRELARRTNGACTHSYISQLESNTSGKKGPYQPDIAIVDALAKALSKSIDEARLAAGYAPTKLSSPPQTIEQLVTALKHLGIEMPMLHGGYPDDDEAFQEVIERIWLDIQMVVNRHNRGHSKPRMIELDITDDVDIENEEINELHLRTG